jgi:hypothetical protein
VAKLPNPDLSRLKTLAPALHVLPTHTRLFRIYFQGGLYPTRWNTFRAYGPTNNRFDHHEEPPRPQSRRVLYTALSAATCYAEVFQATRVIDLEKGKPYLAAFRLSRPLHLLDLTGPWVTQAGASMAISTGSHRQARRWSKAFYETYTLIDGLWYGSSMHGNRSAVALYERAQNAISAPPEVDRPLTHPRLVAAASRVAQAVGYRVAPLRAVKSKHP